MKFLIEKRNYIILLIIILLICFIVFNLGGKKQIYIKSFNYFNKVITVKIYDKVDSNKITKTINDIYKKYESGKGDEDLIAYGKLLYKKSLGYIDITDTSLDYALKHGESLDFKTKINENYDKNNFDLIISSYATSEVIDYFRQNDISSYIINENGNITVGKHYDNGKFRISINKYKGDVLTIVNLEGKSMATVNKTDSINSYMINPKTSSVSDNFDSVTVIANDNLTATMLAQTLFLMNEDEGRGFIKSYDAAALWQKNGNISYTDSFKKYEAN